jgi:ornithine carbamoyltransferase
MKPAASPRHIRTMDDLSPDDIDELLMLSGQMRAEHEQGILHEQVLRRANGTRARVATIFGMESLRTRLAIEGATLDLGGATHLFTGDVFTYPSGKTREEAVDVRDVLQEQVVLIAARLKHQNTINALAEGSRIPVINLLTSVGYQNLDDANDPNNDEDGEHPMQALADRAIAQSTLAKQGITRPLTLAFMGDCNNNVAKSDAKAFLKAGGRVLLCGPESDVWIEKEWQAAKTLASLYGGEIAYVADPLQAVKDADAVATDVWVSMNSPASDKEAAIQKYNPYQINGRLMAHAPRHSIVLHCLPANKGQEITRDVFDEHHDTIIQQANERTFMQKAVLTWALRGRV